MDTSESFENSPSRESCLLESPYFCQGDIKREFRTLVNNVAGCLSADDVRAILYIESLPTDASAKPLEVLYQLQKKGKFSYYNIEPLEALLRNIHRCDVVDNHIEGFKQLYGEAVTKGIPPSRRVPRASSTTSTASFANSLPAISSASRRLSLLEGQRNRRETELYSTPIAEAAGEELHGPVSLPTGGLETQQQVPTFLTYFHNVPPEGPRQEPPILTSTPSHPVQQSRQHSLQQSSYKSMSESMGSMNQAQSAAIPIQFTQTFPQGLPAPQASLQSQEGCSTEAAVFPNEFSPPSMQHNMDLVTSEQHQPSPVTTTGIQMAVLRSPEANFTAAQNWMPHPAAISSHPSPNGHNFPAMRFQVGERHAFQPPGLPYASHVLLSHTPLSTATAANSQGLNTHPQLPSQSVSPPQRHPIAQGAEEPVPMFQETTTQTPPLRCSSLLTSSTITWNVKRAIMNGIICNHRIAEFIKPCKRLKLRHPQSSRFQTVDLGLKIYPYGLDRDCGTYATLEADMYLPSKWAQQVIDDMKVKVNVRVTDRKSGENLTEGRELSAESKLTTIKSIKIHGLLDHMSIIRSCSVVLEVHVTAELYKSTYTLKEGDHGFLNVSLGEKT